MINAAPGLKKLMSRGGGGGESVLFLGGGAIFQTLSMGYSSYITNLSGKKTKIIRSKGGVEHPKPSPLGGTMGWIYHKMLTFSKPSLEQVISVLSVVKAHCLTSFPCASSDRSTVLFSMSITWNQQFRNTCFILICYDKEDHRIHHFHNVLKSIEVSSANF